MLNNGTQNLWRHKPELDNRFASATGRVRVLEERMLTSEDFRHLADPRLSFVQRREILSKAGYSGEDSTEALVLAARDELDDTLYVLSRGTKLADFLLLDLDYHNAKAIVRFLLLEQREIRHTANMKAAGGESRLKEGQDNIPENLKPLIRKKAPTSPELVFEVLVDLMRESGAAVAPSSMRPLFFKHLTLIAEAAGAGKELASTDLTADRLCFEEMLAMAAEASQHKMKGFLLNYISVLADAANLETLLRVRRSYGTRAFLEEALVPGGLVPEAEISGLYGKEHAAISQAFKKSWLAAEMDPVPSYVTREEIRAFGYKRDLLLLRTAAIGKKATAGGEAILGYWLGKRLEMKNIRLILQAVGRGLDEEEILPLIRPSYKGYRL